MSGFKITTEQKKTIPWKLVMIFVFFTIGITIIGITYYISQKNRIFKEQQANLAAIASLKTEQILQWYSERLGDAATIRNNEPLVHQIEQFLRDENQPGIRQELIRWMGSVTREYNYTGVELVDTKMKLRLSVSSSDSVSFEDNEKELEEVIRDQKIIITDLHLTVSSNRPFMDLLIPLFDPESIKPKPFGVIILRIDPKEYLFPLIQSWPTPSKSSETLLLRQEGDSIVYLNELRHQKNSALNLRLPVANENLLGAKAVKGLEGMYEGVDYRNKPVVGYIAGIPGLPWYIVAKVDKEELQAPIRRFIKITIIITVLLILINAAIFGLWIWDQRVRSYRQQLKNELDRKALEIHFEYLFKYANDIIILTDKHLRIAEVNDRALNTYGYTREEIVGTGALMLRAPSTQKQFTEQVKILDDTGSAFYETVHKRKDGSEFPVEISARVIEIEGTKYYQSIGRDITERRRAEEALRESEAKYRNLTESLDELIYRANPETFVATYVNSAVGRFYGYSVEEWLSDPTLWERTIYPEDKERVFAWFTEARRKMESGSIEYRIIRKDETVRWVEDHVSWEKDEQGNVVSLNGVLYDITGRKQAAENLRRKDEHHTAVIENIFRFVPEGLLVFTKNLNLMKQNKAFDEIVRKYAERLGYTEEELAEKIIEQLRARILAGDTTEIHIPGNDQ